MTQSGYRYKVGELRPSQILFSYGVGAVVDLPKLSAMVMGLEDWDIHHSIELAEERLLAAVRWKLGTQVKRLLSPPMPTDDINNSSPFDQNSRIGIPVAPFPGWVICPRCRLLAPLQSNFFEIQNKPYRPDQTCYVHKHCPKPSKPPAVIPARFLVACEQGHLDDFPWRYFVHGTNSNCNGTLRLEDYGVSGAVTDIQVKCDSCSEKRRLSDAFGELGKKNMPRCRGRHPHLRSFDDTCDEQMKTILLGASNSWFPITLSALSIPTSSNKLAQLVEQNWAALSKVNSLLKLEPVLEAFQAVGQLQELSQYNLDEIWEAIEKKQSGANNLNDTVKDLKTPEWAVFSQPNSCQNTKEFKLRSTALPTGYEAWFSQVVLVEKLREVRALVGFTRIQSPGDFADTDEVPDQYQVSLSRHTPKWVPTTEVKGEGIFLQFKESAIQAWEKLLQVQQHEKLTENAYKQWCQSRGLDLKKVKFPSIRYMLIHSFSHALMRQLAIECGYNTASLRERLYSKTATEDNGPQAGLLIYTASADSEGTLGGLVSLGEPQTLGYHIKQALEQMRLCASDPLCAEHTPFQGAISLHWASCHSCLFAPETSCERGNKYLDRSLLVPTVQKSDLAFFQD